MDRLLTKEQIELLRAGLLASEWCGYVKRPMVNALCDLALQSLSQEAVRDEALEEAAKLCDELAAKHKKMGEKAAIKSGYSAATTNGHINAGCGALQCADLIRALKREPNAAAQDRVAGDDQQCLSSGATSRSTPSGESPAFAASIRELLAEARGYLEGLKLAERIDAALASSGPAPAAPDVSSMVRHLKEASHLVAGLGLPAISGTCDDAAALLAKLGQGWIPVKDKLPPEFPVLCLHENGAMYVGEWNGPPHYKTTHWMPLPPLPGASDD